MNPRDLALPDALSASPSFDAARFYDVNQWEEYQMQAMGM